MPKRIIYTAGYANRTTGEFRNLLKEAGIKLVIDVRRKRSRAWKSSFNAGAQMETTVDPITYMDGSVFGNYSESLEACGEKLPGLGSAIEASAMSAQMRAVCFICAEKQPYKDDVVNCHRVLVAEAVAAELKAQTGQEWGIVHLIDPVDVDVLREPEAPEPKPCEPAGCMKRGITERW